MTKYAQYNLTNSDQTKAQIQATTSISVDDTVLANAGRGQVPVPDDADTINNGLDLTQDPIALVSLV